MTEPKVRIFVSSPADVEHERALVRDIVEALAQEYRPYFKVQAVLWEEEALTAARSFQAGLLRPSECEIVLVMLWSRLGTPLADDPYGGMTGTEWEFVDAVDASARHDTPEVLVYKKIAPRLVDITNAEAVSAAVADRDRLETFFRTHFFNPDGSFRRAFRQFDNDNAFRELVETQLRKLLNRRISAERRFAAGVESWRGSPFRAESPFDVGDERVFTGRETETRELVACLDAQSGSGLFLLTGSSGVGKTSLIRAGLLPHLVRPFLFTDVGACRWCLIEPDPVDPLVSLAAALAGQTMLGTSLMGFGLDAERLARLFRSEPQVGAEQIQAARLQAMQDDLRQSGARAGRLQLVLILDPLDALFDAAALDSPHIRTFATALAALAAQEGIWILISLRSEHLPDLPRLPALAGLLDEHHWIRLEPPPPARIRQVIEIPARVAGIEYEELGRGGERGLIESLELEASALPHWPPLLQQTLEDLYRQARDATVSERAAGCRLTVHDYRQIGGLAGSLLRRADACWETLDADARAGLPILCRALVAWEGGSASRASARDGDLRTLLRDDCGAALVRALIDARLIVAEAVPDPVSRAVCAPARLTLGVSLRRALIQIGEEWRARLQIGRATVALETLLDAPDTDPPAGTDPALDWQAYRAIVSFAHPVLFERWGPVRSWLTDPDNRRDLSLRHQISRQARLWKRTDCNRDYLLGEAAHAAAQVFAQTHPNEIEPLEQDFLDQSWSQLRLQRRRNRLTVGATLAVLLVLAGIALFSAWDASHQVRLNQQSALLREADIAIARGNTPEAVHLALMAGPDLPEPATDALARALSTNRLLAMLQHPGDGADRSRALAFSDDGEQVATLSSAQGAALWVRRGSRFERDALLSDPAIPIHSIRFAGQGDQHVIIGIGATGVWRLPAQPGQAPDWTCGGDENAAIAVDQQGRFLAIAHPAPPDGFGICLLDLNRPGAPLWDRPQHQGTIRSLDFAPDGKRLVSASRDGLARLIETLTGDTQHLLPREGASGRPAIRAVFSPDGRLVAVASLDELVRVYGPDGALIAEFGSMQRGKRSIQIHQSSIRDLAFTPDGQSLVAGDGAGQVVRWDLRDKRGEVLGQHDLGIEQVSVSPDIDPTLGELLVLSLSQDRTARLWTLETGRPVAVFSHAVAISDARFSRDGQHILTAARQDGSARLWSAAAANPLAVRLDEQDHVQHLAMAETPPSPEDGRRALLMATAAFDGRVTVWRHDRQGDVINPVKLLSAVGHRGRVRRVAFSPSVQWLASAGSDGTARVWTLATGEACRLRVASQSRVCRTDGAADCPNVHQVLFAPDERWLLTASSDPVQPVRFWDPGACTALPLPDVFAQDKSRVQAAAVTTAEDGATLVATGSDEGMVRLLRQAPAGDWTQLCQLNAHQATITEISFARDGQWLAAASRDGRAVLYPLATGLNDGVAVASCGEPIYLDGQAGSLYDIQFAPDGKALVTAALEAKAHVWSLDGTLLAELAGHRNRVSSAQFSPDGRWVLTASRDGAVRIWKRPLRAQAQPLEPYLTLNAGLGSAAQARFSPDGALIGAGYWDNAALLWRLWSADPTPDPDLQKDWGRDRARLEVIREAIRFQKATDQADEAKIPESELSTHAEQKTP